MKQIISYIVVCIVAIFGYWVLSYGTVGLAAEKVISFEGITEYKLDNGLKVVLFIDSSKPIVTVNTTYLVGSRYEGYGETGMAHLLEHLMFKGSKNHKDLDREIAMRGGIVNATTSYDRTNYFEVLPASEANLSWALEMEADRMLNAFIAKKDLDTEMTVVRNEFEMGENDSVGILRERMLSAAYLWHNYGHSVIGARSDIENVPIERLKSFYQKYYQPNNAVLVIAGNFVEQQALDLGEKYFGKMKKPQRILIPTYTAEPAQDGERSVTLQRAGNSKAVGVSYHVPAAAHPDYAAVEILTEILGGSSGRLYRALVEPGKAVGVMADADCLKESGMVSFLAAMRTEQDVAEVRENLLAVLADAGNIPPSPEELDRARKQILYGMEEALNSPENMGIQLSDWIACGDWRLFFLQRQRLQSVTAEDVMRVAKCYLVKENRTIGEFVPTTKISRVEIPQVINLAQELKKLQPAPSVVLGEIFDTSPKNIDERMVIPEVTSGLQLAFLPKVTRGQMVEVSMALHFGTAELLNNKALAGELASAMLLRGTTKHSREELQDLLVQNKATVSVNGDAAGVDVDVHVPKENLREILNLIAEIVRQPAFSETEFSQCKQEYLAYIEESKVDPLSIGMIYANRHFAPYEISDIRNVMDFDEKISALQMLTNAEVKRFYQEFYGASTMEISMVGDVDPQEMTKEVQSLFGNWQSKNIYQRIDVPFVKIEPTNISITTPDKENAVFVAMAPIKITKNDSDYPALIVANYLVGEGGFNSRLGNRIRNQEGLSYSVSSQLAVDEKSDFGRIIVSAFCAPQNVEKVEKAFKQEMTRALQDGFSQEELKNAKQGIIEVLKMDRAVDTNIAQIIRSNLYYHRNVKELAKLEEKITVLTTQQVVEAMRRYIAVEDFTIVEVGDFKK